MGEAAKKADEKKEEVLVPVGPGAEGLDEKLADQADEADEKDDRRLGQAEESDESEPAGKDKETSRERRDRLKRKRARDQKEMNFYRQRNEELERRFAMLESRTSQNEGAAIDQRLNTLNSQIAAADRLLAEAIKKNQGDDAAEALKIRDNLRDETSRLTGFKQQVARRAQEPQPQQQVVRDPEMVAFAQQWAEDHPWFEFYGTDRDSAMVRRIDNELGEEGIDSSSAEYWEELSSRVREAVPHRFKGNGKAHDDEESDGEEGEAPARRPASRAASGPKFSSGGRERPLKKGEVYISKERREALIQAGLWEDPVARNRMLKRYADMDAKVASERQSSSWQ